MGGRGGKFSSHRNFFSLSNSLYEFFLGHRMNTFVGLIGVHEFFHLIFLARIFFCTSPAQTPHKFSNGPSLNKSSDSTLAAIGHLSASSPQASSTLYNLCKLELT